MHKGLIQISVILLSVVILYSPLRSGFFQQDEWLAFGRHFLLSNSGLGELLKNAFWNTGAHFIPLNFLTIHSFFRLFQLDPLGYTIISIILHLLNTLLVYVLANKLIKKQTLAFFASLLFGIMSAHSQATTWIVADLSIHLASAFGLLSLIFFVKLLQDKNSKYFNYSIFFLVISLLFKEITLGLFPLYFIILFPKFKRYAIIIAGIGALYALLRVVLFLQPGPEVYEQTSHVPESSSSIILYNLVSAPLSSLGQIVIPSSALITLSQFTSSVLPTSITGQEKTIEYDRFLLKRVIPGLTFLVFVICMAPLVFLIKKYKKKDDTLKLLLVSSFFIFLNSLVFAITPERQEKITLIDSRNLYFTAVGVSIFVVTLLGFITKYDRLRFVLLIIPLILMNVYFLNKDINSLVTQAKVRRHILEKIKLDQPSLQEKTIFYTESDSSFYGLSEREQILPFQSGFGQTLIIWYYPSNKLPDEFLKNKFLWGITDQGYREVNGVGFGYFRNFPDMVQAIEENKLTSDSVVAFRYNSKYSETINITSEVRGRVNGYQSDKRAIPSNLIKITSDFNSAGITKMYDSDRQTFWDSKVPYINPQSLLIENPSNKSIAAIKIDSFEDKNQDKVGYEVLLSNNGNDWKEVFYSKKYLPDENGLLYLYFQPQKAKLIRINQIGSHQHASWIIHELELYESLEN